MTTNIISTLRPGLLVSLKTSIRGNVSYQTRDLEHEHAVAGGQTRARWETERTVANKAELTRAVKARTAARTAITSVCSRSSFGLLCPEAWGKALQDGITRARQVAAEFNARARVTELAVYVIVGRVAQDDVEAVRAINSEVRDLMRDMTVGIKELDVKRVRDAANRARSVGSMLTPEAAERVKAAIDAARGAARQITKAGEEAAKEVDREAIKKINQARTAFLDLDASAVLPTRAPAARGRAVDLAPDDGKGLIDSAADSARAMKKAQGKLRPGPQFDLAPEEPASKKRGVGRRAANKRVA